MRFNAVSDFSKLATYCNGKVEKFACQAQFAEHFGLHTISQSNLIPIAADSVLNRLQPRPWIEGIRLVNSGINYFCFQWNNSDQKAVASVIPESPYEASFLYEYDASWLSSMPFLHALDHKSESFSLRDGYQYDSVTLQENEIFIGGSNNISHFIGNFLPKIILASQNLGLTPVLFNLHNWQRELLDLALGEHRYREISTRPYDVRLGAKILRVYDTSGWLLEDLPSYIGLPIALVLLRDLFHYRSDYRNSQLSYPRNLYLTRIKYEHRERLDYKGFIETRNVNWRQCLSTARSQGYHVIFPEELSIEAIYRQVSHAEHIVSDLGSCNIHILMNSSFLERASHGIALASIATQKLDHDVQAEDHYYRNYEWLLHIRNIPNLTSWEAESRIRSLDEFLKPTVFSDSVFKQHLNTKSLFAF